MAIQGVLDDIGGASAASGRLPVPNGDEQIAMIDDVMADAPIGIKAQPRLSAGLGGFFGDMPGAEPHGVARQR